MKKANLFLVFLSILPLKSFSLGLPKTTWQKAVVQVRSYPCAAARPIFEGSGILIKNKNGIQVLTSEHVLFHSQQAYFCHEFRTEQGLAIPAQLINVSYVSGMAILKPQAARTTDALALESLAIANEFFSLENEKSISSNSPLTAMGFPSHSTNLQILNEGKLINLKSKRFQIAGIHSVIEVSGLPVEYGMSGGILLSPNSQGNLVFIGLLSHQVLKRRPSEPGRIEDNTQGATAEDLTLALTLEDILNWMTAGQNWNELQWRREPRAQIESHELITYGPLQWSLIKKPAKDIIQGGSDPTGIGGSDATGVGGGSDATGIGGGSGGTNETLDTIKITLDPQAAPALKALDLKNDLLNNWKKQILAGKNVYIPYLRSPAATRLQSFTNLGQFFTPWLQGQATPVTLISADADLLKNTTSLENGFQSLFQKIQILRGNTPDLEQKAWLGMLREQVLLAYTGLIFSAELETLFQGAHAEIWKAFYNENFDEAVELETLLRTQITKLHQVGR